MNSEHRGTLSHFRLLDRMSTKSFHLRKCFTNTSTYLTSFDTAREVPSDDPAHASGGEQLGKLGEGHTATLGALTSDLPRHARRCH
jgi:hypothetical protein